MASKSIKTITRYWQLIALSTLGIYEILYNLFGVGASFPWVTFIAFSSIIVLKSIQGQSFSRVVDSNLSLSQSILTKERQVKHLSEELDSNKADFLIINRLLSEGAINKNDIISGLKDTAVYFVYCYAFPFPEVDQKFRVNRLYPDHLEKLGFVRVDRMGRLFISTEERLTKDLWSPKMLLNFLKSEIDEALKQEWGVFLEKLQKESRKKRKLLGVYNEYKTKRYDYHLKMKIIIGKSFASDFMISDIPTSIELKKLGDLLIELTNLKKLMKPLDKVKIRTVLESTSITYLVDSLSNIGKKKLTDAEPSIRENFDIETIFDYRFLSKHELAEILSTSFRGEKVVNIAEQIIEGSGKLWDSFKRLGLN